MLKIRRSRCFPGLSRATRQINEVTTAIDAAQIKEFDILLVIFSLQNIETEPNLAICSPPRILSSR